MKCTKIQEWFSDYLEDTIESPQQIVFEQHLAECRQCKEDYEQFRATVMLLEEVPEIEIPLCFHETVITRVERARRMTPCSVKWWNIDWKSVVNARVPAKAVAMGFAVLMLLAVLINLNPVNSITAVLFPQPTSNEPTIGAKIDTAPGPLPYGANRRIEARYDRNAAGLSIDVTVDSSSSDRSVYLLKFMTNNLKSTDLHVSLLPNGALKSLSESDDKNVICTDSITRDQGSVVPIIVTRSNDAKRSVVVKVAWTYNGKNYSQFVFVPSDFNSAATTQTQRSPYDEMSVYNAMQKVSADYGIVVIASGNLDNETESVKTSNANSFTVLSEALSQTGLQMKTLTPSMYVVEQAK